MKYTFINGVLDIGISLFPEFLLVYYSLLSSDLVFLYLSCYNASCIFI